MDEIDEVETRYGVDWSRDVLLGWELWIWCNRHFR